MSPDSAARRHLRVLMVDDSADDVSLVQEVIAAFDLPILLDSLESGEAALGRLLDSPTAEHPDLVLLDFDLPGCSGVEVLARLKQAEATRTVPVVMLSSSSEAAEVGAAYRCHANCYIQKPTALDGLLILLRSLVHFWRDLVRLPGPSRTEART